MLAGEWRSALAFAVAAHVGVLLLPVGPDRTREPLEFVDFELAAPAEAPAAPEQLLLRWGWRRPWRRPARWWTIPRGIRG